MICVEIMKGIYEATTKVASVETRMANCVWKEAT
jgi:hypothetical protein